MRPLLLPILLIPLVSCSSGTPAAVTASDDRAITIGSFDFPESVLLAEIYAQALESAGLEVLREFEVGPREVLSPALQNGLIELIPEYQGSALTFLGGTPSPDPIVTQLDLERAASDVGLAALGPSRAENVNTFAVTRATAAEIDLVAISDLRGDEGEMRFGGPAECPQRPLCLEGLEDVYGLSFGTFVPLDAGGPLTVRALRDGLVDVALLFSTSDALDDGDLVALRDDRGLQPAEHVVPILRPEILELGPVEQVLGEISARLTTEDLQRMNGEVAAGDAIAEIASAWLGDSTATAQG